MEQARGRGIARLAGLRGLIAVLLSGLLFHLVAYYLVKAYYAVHVPHYDSIGAYTTMFQLMNMRHQQGFWAAASAATKHHLSWLQSWFALIGAPVLWRAPESLQVYNSLWVVVFMVAVYLAARSMGMSQVKACLISLVVFSPDVLFDWSGGYLDLSRDPSFVSLLGATYFLFFSQVWDPTPRKGIVLGILAGLTVLSRGNAIIPLTVTMGPIVGLWMLWKLYRREAWAIVRSLGVSFLTMGVMAALNLYYTYGLTMERYRNPFVAYAIGDNGWTSLRAHWRKPLQIMFGTSGARGGGVYGTLEVTMGALILLAGAAIGLRWLGIMTVNRSTRDDEQSRALAAGGVWAIVGTVLVTCLVIRLKPNVGFQEAKLPFYPALLGFVSFLVVLARAVRFNPVGQAAGRWWLGGVLAVTCAGVLFLGATRIARKTPDATPQYVELASELTDVLAGRGERRVVAFMWHETINFDTIRYELAKRGTGGPRKFFFWAADGTTLLDFAATTPPGTDVQALQTTLRQQIERNADLVVLTTQPGGYEIANHRLFVFAYGQPVVDALIGSSRFRRVFTYEIRGIPFVVLENMLRG